MGYVPKIDADIDELTALEKELCSVQGLQPPAKSKWVRLVERVSPRLGHFLWYVSKYSKKWSPYSYRYAADRLKTVFLESAVDMAKKSQLPVSVVTKLELGIPLEPRHLDILIDPSTAPEPKEPTQSRGMLLSYTDFQKNWVSPFTRTGLSKAKAQQKAGHPKSRPGPIDETIRLKQQIKLIQEVLRSSEKQLRDMEAEKERLEKEIEESH